MAKTIRVIISGRVQGVSYRAWTVATASQYGLKGWVRNRRDGTVEAVFHGSDASITAMVEACKKGPAAARVDKIESYQSDDIPDSSQFIALPTV